jgi:tetratricopeptide (TPR) repeat protein
MTAVFAGLPTHQPAAPRGGDAQDRDGALKATREAVDICRELAVNQPEAFMPQLAASLDSLGMVLSKTVDLDGALKATREAIDIRRELAKTWPESFIPQLAASLHRLGTVLSEAGDRDRALQATREAVNIRRKLVERWPHMQADLDVSVQLLASLQAK